MRNWDILLSENHPLNRIEGLAIEHSLEKVITKIFELICFVSKHVCSFVGWLSATETNVGFHDMLLLLSTCHCRACVKFRLGKSQPRSCQPSGNVSELYLF